MGINAPNSTILGFDVTKDFKLFFKSKENDFEEFLENEEDPEEIIDEYNRNNSFSYKIQLNFHSYESDSPLITFGQSLAEGDARYEMITYYDVPNFSELIKELNYLKEKLHITSDLKIMNITGFC